MIFFLKIKKREKENVISNLKKNIEANQSDILQLKRSNIGKEETIASQNRTLSAIRKEYEESDRYISTLKKQLNDQVIIQLIIFIKFVIILKIEYLCK